MRGKNSSYQVFRNNTTDRSSTKAAGPLLNVSESQHIIGHSKIGYQGGLKIDKADETREPEAIQN